MFCWAFPVFSFHLFHANILGFQSETYWRIKNILCMHFLFTILGYSRWGMCVLSHIWYMLFHFHFSLGEIFKCCQVGIFWWVSKCCSYVTMVNGVISKFMGEISDVKCTHWVSTTINFIFLPSRNKQKTGRKTLQMWAGARNLYSYMTQ